MQTVNIKKTEDGKLLAYSPYNPNLPPKAKQLGGRWNGECWTFDSRDEERVKELYVNIYGTDGEIASGDLITVKAEFKEKEAELHGGIFVGGRLLATAFGRDSGVKLGSGIIILEGNFYSGGSMKNWKTIVSEGTVFEIRDIPRTKISEIENDDRLINVTVIEPENKDSLIKEKEKLLQRISEIDAVLNK